jgi:hypothetical protein
MADKEPPATAGADASSAGTPSGPAGMWPGPRPTAPTGGQVDAPLLTNHSGVKSAILGLIGGTDFSSEVELILFYVELNQLHYEG